MKAYALTALSAVAVIGLVIATPMLSRAAGFGAATGVSKSLAPSGIWPDAQFRSIRNTRSGSPVSAEQAAAAAAGHRAPAQAGPREPRAQAEPPARVEPRARAEAPVAAGTATSVTPATSLYVSRTSRTGRLCRPVFLLAAIPVITYKRENIISVRQ